MKEETVARRLMGLRPTIPTTMFVAGGIVVKDIGGECPFRGEGNYCRLVCLDLPKGDGKWGSPSVLLSCGKWLDRPAECPLRDGPVVVREEK